MISPSAKISVLSRDTIPEWRSHNISSEHPFTYGARLTVVPL
jgi:hypothetical protein